MKHISRSQVNFRRPSWDPLGQSVLFPFGERKNCATWLLRALDLREFLGFGFGVLAGSATVWRDAAVSATFPGRLPKPGCKN